MQGQVYLTGALGQFSAAPGGQPVDPGSQDAEPRANDDCPDPPLESFRIVFEVIGTRLGVE